jgi:hypothetical protein
MNKLINMINFFAHCHLLILVFYSFISILLVYVYMWFEVGKELKS